MIDSSNKSFCMYPWVHIHTAPTGIAAPCCIAKSCSDNVGVGDAKISRLINLVNSSKMNKLRLDMIAGKKNEECESCYLHEEQGINSFRQASLKKYGQLIDESLANTEQDGSLKKFEMKYFDIRFNNICNFKCRTCGQEYSSQWEQENLKNDVGYARIIPKNQNKLFLQDVIDQIEYMDTAYFAGGEPLITEEHYIILEEMIRKNKTDIYLRYNTNLSNLKFKDKDLLSLWSNFKVIDISASIDHYGERAEYIRHGTDWAVIETNFNNIKQYRNVRLSVNTVLSVFNYLTLHKFYQYMIDKKFYTRKSNAFSLYFADSPYHISCHILPKKYKELGKLSLDKSISHLENHAFDPDNFNQMKSMQSLITVKDTWGTYGTEFKTEIARLDQIRNEDFAKVFSELAELLYE